MNQQAQSFLEETQSRCCCSSSSLANFLRQGVSGFCTQRGLDCQALGKLHRRPALEAEGRALRQQDELDEWPLLQFRPHEDSILSPHGHWMPVPPA